MKNSTVRYVLALLTLVLGAAGEELLPKVLDVGFPLLLAGTVFFAQRPSVAVSVLFALAAGGAEDALSSLPFLASASYFLFVAALVHLTKLPYLIAPLAFPVYQFWLCIWVAGLRGSVFTRGLLALPIGALTIAAVLSLLAAIERKAGADEED